MDGVDVCNLALAQLGSPRFIGDFYEGSRASRIALRVYPQARDDLLRSKDWPFARRTAQLSVLKRAVIPVPVVLGQNNWTIAQPPPPWLWSYIYPPDCLLLRYVRLPPVAVTGGDADVEPKPNLFVIANDIPPPPLAPVYQRTILCNLPFAIAHYTGQVINPDTWEPMFTEALVDALKVKFTAALAGGQQAPLDLKTEMLAEAGATEAADRRRG